MSEKFTKRQWSVGYEFVGDDCVLAVLNSDGDEVCNFGNSLLNEPVNANLIAAAPEMYEALDTLVALVGLTAFKYEYQRAVLQGAMNGAMSALKKARGES